MPETPCSPYSGTTNIGRVLGHFSDAGTAQPGYHSSVNFQPNPHEMEITDHTQAISPGSRVSSGIFTALRLLLLAAAAACIYAAFTMERFRRPDGSWGTEICFPLAAAAGFAFLAYAIRTSWRTAAAWLFLALIGQAAALQMIDAGHLIKYAHFRPFGVLAAEYPLYLAVLAAQTAFVAFGLRRRGRAIASWLRSNFSLWQMAVLAAAFVLTAATVSRDVAFYAQELVFAAFVQFVNLMTIILAAMSLPDSAAASAKRFFGRFLDRENTSGLDRTIVIFAVAAGVIAALLCYFSYERHPHIQDETTYVFHAKYLAKGLFYMQPPPVPEAFTVDFSDYDATRWFSSVPPGWPLVLSIGMLFGAGWLVDPLLTAVCVILTYIFVRDLYDERTARLSAVLMAVSPWMLLVGMSFMTHMSALAVMLAAAVFAQRARRSGSILLAFLCGAAAAFVGVIRPLEGVVVVGLIGLWVIGIGGKRFSIEQLAAFAAGGGIVGAAALYYNYFFTGSPTKFPVMAWTDKYMGVGTNALGFGPNRGAGWPIDPYPGHSPLEAIINSNLNITAINTDMFGWAAGSLILILVFLLFRRFQRADLLMFALIAGVYIAHFFYWFSGGPDFAARYWFQMVLPYIVLSARGIQELSKRLNNNGSLDPRLLTAVAALSLMALVNFVPWRAVDKYHTYLNMSPQINALSAEHHFGKSLVLIRGERFPDYASAAVYNPVDLTSDTPIYAWDRDPETRERVLAAFPDRPVWIINGPTITGRGYEIAADPGQ